MEHTKLLQNFSELHGRVGVFGGSFDPIHNGHLKIARYAHEAEQLDAIIFVPAKKNPLKERSPRASDEERLDMLELALCEHSSYYITDLELRRDGVSFTITTLREIASKLVKGTKLYLIVGSDSLPQLHLWREIENIFSIATIVTVEREAFLFSRLEELRDSLGSAHIEVLRSHFIRQPLIPISATQIRADASKGRMEAVLTPEVAEYIRSRGLYGSVG